MQCDWMQCIPCSMKKWNPIECGGFYAACLNEVDSCRIIECSGFFAAWPKASRLNAVESMQCDWMQWIPCSLVKCILFECRGIHAAWLNAVYSMQYEEMEPYWMRGILCSMLEWSGFLHNNWMQWIFCSMAQSIPIECSGFHAAWLNAVESMQHDWMQRNHAAW